LIKIINRILHDQKYRKKQLAKTKKQINKNVKILKKHIILKIKKYMKK